MMQLQTSTRFWVAFSLLSFGFCLSVQVQPADAKKVVFACAVDYKKKFTNGRIHKAMATTGGRSITAYNTACGWAEGYSSKAQAVRDALRQCERSNKMHKLKTKCRVIAAK
jgi:hypothetical protein